MCVMGWGSGGGGGGVICVSNVSMCVRARVPHQIFRDGARSDPLVGEKYLCLFFSVC